MGKLGSYEEKRKKLQEERKKEYNKLIAGVNIILTISHFAIALCKTTNFQQEKLFICISHDQLFSLPAVRSGID